MELRQLEHFIAVAEESSFTRAAQRLGVVQSTLSVSVRTWRPSSTRGYSSEPPTGCG